MATNKRNFYAVYEVGLKENGAAGDVIPVSGLQSCGLTTTFNLEQVFQIGQIDIYENIETLPDVELTLEKVLDGTPLICHLATPAATVATLNGRFSNNQSLAKIAYFNDTSDAASGSALNVVTCSGLYVGSMTFTFPVDGNCTESVTFVGNDKWNDDAEVFTGDFNNAGTPPGTGGVQRRENVDMSASTWPTEIPGITGSGTNNLDVNGVYSAHIQNVTVSCDLGRNNLFELGRRGPYYKFMSIPVEVSTSIELNQTEEADNIDAYAEQDNLTNQTIIIATDEGTTLNLGTKNKLRSVTLGGGSTGGELSTVSLQFVGYNTFTISHTQDPAAL